MLLPTSFYYGRKVFDLMEELNCVTDADALIEKTFNVFTAFGAEHLAVFARLPTGKQQFHQILLLRHVSPEWDRMYAERGYVHVDPLVRHLRHMDRPFEWREARFDPEREPRAAEVMRNRSDLLFEEGLVVPIRNTAGKGGASIGGTKLDLSPDSKRAIHLTALYAFDRICSLRGQPLHERPYLTEREREVLTWVAIGKSAWEIGEILSITKRTADAHARAAFLKLGAANRTHAVAIALRDHIIAI